MIRHNAPCDATVHIEAVRAARECRRVIQALLREEEVQCCEEEFYKVIREALERVKNG